MYINRLCEGLVVKNYKEMCKLLDEKILEGNSKKAQLKEWKRYFDYEKDGQKFIIIAIYDSPLDKQDGRENGNNAIYVKYIELLLMYLLSQQKGYTYTLTKHQWYQTLGMTNYNFKNYYGSGTHNMLVKSNKISDIVTKFDVDDFYRRVPQCLDKILFSALNSLKNRCLIQYEEQTVIVKDMIRTIATDKEKKQILQVKKQALKDMGLESMYQVFWKFKTQEYFDSVNNYLKDLYGWEKTLTQYKIIFVKDDIISEIPQTEFVLRKYQLNNEIVKVINNEMIKNYNKTNAKYEEDYNMMYNELLNENYGEHNIQNSKLFKYSDSYIDAQETLSDFLLKIPKN